MEAASYSLLKFLPAIKLLTVRKRKVRGRRDAAGIYLVGKDSFTEVCAVEQQENCQAG